MTARARALETAMRRAGLLPEGGFADLESFLMMLDPDSPPDLVDGELVAQIVDWLVALHAEARARELAEALIAHVRACRP